MRSLINRYGWIINDTAKLLFLTACCILGFVGGHYLMLAFDGLIFG
jgi:hypothetical protein